VKEQAQRNNLIKKIESVARHPLSSKSLSYNLIQQL